MSNLKRKEVANVAARTNVAASAPPLSDRDAAQTFSATVIPFSAADLARAAHRTKAAAKGWKDATRAPSASSLINLARELPAVKAWLLAQIGHGDEEFYRPYAEAELAAMRLQLSDIQKRLGDK